MHARKHRNAEGFAHNLAGMAAGNAVPARGKSGAREKYIRFKRGYEAEQLFTGFFGLFRKIVIAADNRADNFSLITEGFLQKYARPDDPFFDGKTHMRLVFTADLSVKLVDVVNRTYFFHTIAP